MAKAIARVATELAKRKARSAGKFPKGKKGSKAVDARTSRSVSYTHLTLPTIYSV